MGTESIEGDHYPEIVENGGAMQFVEQLGFDKEDLKKAYSRRELLSSLSDEELVEMVFSINRFVTNGQETDSEFKDGQVVAIDTPKLEDKEPLMRLASKTIKEIASDADLGDQDALHRAGLTFSGAISYIHPFENGNGRTARTGHYMIEFGMERGEKLFEQELYAIIGKLPMYESDDGKKALDNPLRLALTQSLDAYAAHNLPEYFEEGDERAMTVARVLTFLDVMRGKLHVPINQEVLFCEKLPKEEQRRVVGENGRTRKIQGKTTRYPSGSLDCLQYYELSYLSTSTIPNRDPDYIPRGLERVRGERVQDVSPPPHGYFNDTV